MDRIGTRHQRLCRSASCIHAGSAKFIALDNGDRFARICKPRCQRRSRLARPDNDGVEMIHGAVSVPPLLRTHRPWPSLRPFLIVRSGRLGWPKNWRISAPPTPVTQVQIRSLLLDADHLKPGGRIRQKRHSLHDCRSSCIALTARDLRRQCQKEFVYSFCCQKLSKQRRAALVEKRLYSELRLQQSQDRPGSDAAASSISKHASQRSPESQRLGA